LIGGRLGTKAAVFGTAAGFHVYDGTEMNFVSFEIFTNAISPGKEIKDIGTVFEIEEPKGVFAPDQVTVEDTGSEFRDARVIGGVK
jgi:hypothetical protein